MAFEDSPDLDGNPARRTPLDRVFVHRRAILGSAIAFGCVFLALLWLTAIANRPPDLPYGRLDGCLQTREGAPAAAVMEVAAQTRATYADGCFYFAALPAGVHLARVRVDGATVWQGSVTIRAGQATALGTLQLRH